MSFAYWVGAFARVTFSVFCAGVFYVLWLAAFLQAAKTDSSGLKLLGWVSAPVVTAAGFAAGLAIAERLTRTGKVRFLAVFTWPLLGCVVGAGTVCWFGPMLIVFGMFLLGTVSIAFREVLLAIEKHSQL